MFYTYTQGIDTVQPAKTFMDDLNTRILADSAWSLVETVTSGTIIVNVYKSSGSVNSLGSDFYFAVKRTTLTSGVGFMLSEGYDAVNHKMQKGAVYISTAGTTMNSDGTYPTDKLVASQSTQNAVTDGFLFNGGMNNVGVSGTPMTPATGGNTYYESINHDRIIIAQVAAPASMAFLYAGMYDSFNPSLDPMPLCIFGSMSGWPESAGTTQNNFGAFTRTLTRPSQAISGALALFLDEGFSQTFDPMQVRGSTSISAWTPWVDQIAQKYLCGKVVIIEEVTLFALRGTLKDAAMVVLADTSWNIGDQLTIDGSVYAIMNERTPVTPSTSTTTNSQHIPVLVNTQA